MRWFPTESTGGPAHAPGSFLALDPPETDDVARVLAGTARRILRRFERSGAEVDEDGHMTPMNPSRYVELGEQPSGERDQMHLSVAQLWTLVREFSSGRESTTAFEVDLHLKLATPVACLLLPALVMIFAVSGPPFPSPAFTLVLAGAIAIGYTLSAGAFASFGRRGVLPPWAGGWGPSLSAITALVGLAW